MTLGFFFVLKQEKNNLARKKNMAVNFGLFVFYCAIVIDQNSDFMYQIQCLINFLWLENQFRMRILHYLSENC